MPDTETKPLLILDLDETLVHAADSALEIPHDFKAGPYFVYKRPFVDDFICTLATSFQLAVWSSSTADYIAAITAQIIPDHVSLRFAWSRTRCIQRYHPEWQGVYWVKDLKKVKRLGYELSRILVVDDTPQKLERNYGNAVYVSSFDGDPADQELKLLAPYLMSLVDCNDYRTIEKRGWRSNQ
ncbi:HAD family hydrolase [Roseimaritima sediminicola]|uniref:HAD family hydrolase n=1 Tax=Roseimaritima sediminicola TaxID=2662066 RepID=UPI00129848C3|nr:HAD family hydrolase [Roseimaritima sediminicola]